MKKDISGWTKTAIKLNVILIVRDILSIFKYVETSMLFYLCNQGKDDEDNNEHHKTT